MVGEAIFTFSNIHIVGKLLIWIKILEMNILARFTRLKSPESHKFLVDSQY